MFACMCVCVSECACSSIQTDLHPFKLFIGCEGSCWDTFDQILLQTAEREGKRNKMSENIKMHAI